MEMSEAIFVPVILFIIFVAPIWLWLHYRERQRERDQAGKVQVVADSTGLAETAARMEQRVAALEALLDAESPDWRKRNE